MLLFHVSVRGTPVQTPGPPPCGPSHVLTDTRRLRPPAVNVHMPKDRVTMNHQGYGFVEFMGEDDADYAIKVMNMIKLYGKPIRVNKVSV